jgi:hypothetical protein
MAFHSQDGDGAHGAVPLRPALFDRVRARPVDGRAAGVGGGRVDSRAAPVRARPVDGGAASARAGPVASPAAGARARPVDSPAASARAGAVVDSGAATVRAKGEAGFVGGFEALLFGALLFVAGTLLLSYAWGVVDTKAATEEAARQAATSYVQAGSPASANAVAAQAADAALEGYGRDPNRARVGLMAGSFGRCQRVTISVSYPAPALMLPFVGPVGSGPQVKAEHSELVDPFRTGLPGTASCP